MRIWRVSWICLMFLGLFILSNCCVQAADADILEQYAPIYQFTSNECCYPVDIEYFLENSDLYEYSDEGSIIRETNPASGSLRNASGDLYLDNMRGTIMDDGIIADYQSKLSGLGYTIYGRVVDSGLGGTVLQYWTFYTFNKGSLNIHEGDWEMVQVVLVNNSPSEVMFSQHHSGTRATWTQVDKNGDNVIIYVAEGTHANYVRSYSGRFGIANDVVGDSGRRISNTEYSLEVLSSQGWLDFSGKWGYNGGPEDELRGKTGPEGPKFREQGEMWNTALIWGQELPAADNNVFIIEWLLANFLLIFILLTVLILAILIFRIYHRHLDTGLGPRKVSLLYIDGVNNKSIGNILCIVGVIIAVIGLISPWYFVSGDINVPGHETEGFVELISIDGLNGVQINLLDPTIGITPLSVFILPFSLIIGIGLVLFILGTIGVSSSRKLGRKYMIKGIRLMIPIILILIILIILGSIVNISDLAPTESTAFENILADVSSTPWGGAVSYSIPEYTDAPASVSVQWGLGMGGIMLLLSGIVMLLAGFFENSARTEFFKEITIDDTLNKMAAQQEKSTTTSLNEELLKEKKRQEKDED